MRGTEALTVTADGRKPAAFRTSAIAETSSDGRSLQAVHAALGAAGRRLGQFALLVLTLWFALCAGMTDANALSASCAKINSDWSAGVTFDSASLPPGYHDLFDEYNLADGETLTWSVTGSGVVGSHTFAAFFVGNGVDWVHSESSDLVGSFSDSGSHTFSPDDTYAILQALVNKSSEPAYIDDPATVTMTASCSDGSPPLTDATLSGLSLSQGTLDPAFDSATTDYIAAVGNAVTSLTVTPTATDANATITVNGTPLTSGNASGAIALDVGDNTITVIVTAENGTTTETYTVIVTRAAPASTDATLSGLSLSQGTLDPAFDSATTDYIAAVANAVASLTVTPTATDANATITVNGTPVTSGNASGAIDLNVGDNTITVIVTAENGTTTETYTVVVTRAAPASTDATLSGLSLSQGTLDPVFDSATTDYIAAVANAVASLTVTPTATDANATITVNGVAVASGNASGAIDLNVGDNTITVIVTAENGTTTETYTVTVNRRTAAAIAMDPVSGSALPEAMAGEDYSFTITATGGIGAILFARIAGDLPAGMILNISTGELSGPLAADTEGDYSFTIEARDSQNNTATASYTLTVGERRITVANQEITVPEGGTPPNVNLTRGATGGPFWDAVILSVEPAGAGEASIVNAEFAQAGGNTPLQFYLKFTPNPAFSGQAKVSFQLVSALGTSNVGTVTYNLSYDPAVVARDIDGLVRGFVRTRQNLIASTIKVPSLIDRRRFGAVTAPISSSLSPSGDGLTLNFATSLAQMSAAADAAEGLGSAGTYSLPFNMWVDGTVMVHNREQNGNRWGSFGMISAGADYLINDKALVGLSVHFDGMTDPTDQDARLTGKGWLAGPYASFELGGGVFWDTSLLYGGSSNTIDTAFWDGSFDTRRWLFDTSIKGQWQLDAATTLSPRLRAVYFSEIVPNYQVENGSGSVLSIDGFTTEQFRVSLGAELARQFTFENGSTLTPTLDISGGFAGLDGSGAFGSVGAGLSFANGGGWSLDSQLRFNIDGGGQTSAGAKVRLGVSF